LLSAFFSANSNSADDLLALKVNHGRKTQVVYLIFRHLKMENFKETIHSVPICQTNCKALIIVALARPQSTQKANVTSEGISIVLIFQAACLQKI
jgi:hypothetical protein